MHEGFINDIENELGDYFFSKSIEDWLRQAMPKLPSFTNPTQMVGLDEYFHSFQRMSSGTFSQQMSPDKLKLIESAVNHGGDIHNMIYLRQKMLVPVGDDLIPMVDSGQKTPSVSSQEIILPDELAYHDPNNSIPAYIRGYSAPFQTAGIYRFPFPD